jgi:hypothetical protein
MWRQKQEVSMARLEWRLATTVVSMLPVATQEKYFVTTILMELDTASRLSRISRDNPEFLMLVRR